MRDLGKDIRSFLLSQATVKNIVSGVHQSSVPAKPDKSYVWFTRAGSEALDALGDTAGAEPFRQVFDMECISDNLDRAQRLADAITDLFPMRGTFGSASVQGAFVTTQDDYSDYRGVANDRFSHVAALSLEIIP